MRKICATILSLCVLSALLLPTAANTLGQNPLDTAALSQAPLQAQNTESAEEIKSGLIAPQTYEEYLSLTDPACVAVCENYTAIADGNTIYVFDREENVYKTYVHGSNSPQNVVKKLQFYGGNTLYFADNATGDNFYKLNAETLETATEINHIACGTFLIAGEDLYFTNSQGSLYATTLQAAENNQEKEPLSQDNVSALAYYNEELYFVRSDTYLHKINPKNGNATSNTFLHYFQQVVSSMTISEGVLVYTSSNGGLYAYSLADITETGLQFKAENDDYKNVYSWGNKVYTVQQGTGIIKEYSVADKTFTDFEISSNSSAVHRLSGATDAALFKDTLYIADNGNSRLSAYDCKNKQLTARFPLTTDAQYISTDGQGILTASHTEATLYSLTGETLTSYDTFNGKITGIASVYGVHYVVTENNYFYSITQDTEGVWQRTEVKKTSTHPPQQLAADAYGNLYIRSGGYAYAFSEETFMQADGNGIKLTDNIPTSTVKIAVDYDGNLYALADGIYRYERQTDGGYTQTSVDLSQKYVFGDAPTITAFAFGIEKNAAYLLCNGNYLLQTTNFNLPTVTNIPVENADESIFAKAEASFEIIKTKPRTLLIAFDINKLEGAESFPYLSYMRSENEKTALKIGEDSKGKYNLIAHFDEETSKYSTYLVLKSACETLQSEHYRTDYSENEQKDGWLTNALSLYKFPYLCDKLLVTETLPRGGKITLLGEIVELDHEYYRIAYTDENGNMQTGYIPKSYATLFDASPKAHTLTTVGVDENNHDAVWRLAYILLGLGAVGILADYLILRKKKDD